MYFGKANSTSKPLFHGKNLVTSRLYTERKTDALVWIELTRYEILFINLQCFKSKDDNFSWNYFISKGQFQIYFSQPMIDSTFCNSYGGSRGHVLPHIRGTKCGINHELRKVDLKLTLTKEIISQKIVVSRVETL